MRYKITLSYDGSAFSGWQTQKSRPTVQGAVEDALFGIFGENLRVTGSGRTDEGVHALGQVAHFDCPVEKAIVPGKLIGALNFYLPPQIRVYGCEEAGDDFHARKSAKSKTYQYDAYNSETENPFLTGRALRLPPGCDTQLMKEAAEIFVGTHDFTAFRNLGSAATTTVRTVTECSIGDVVLAGNQTGIRLTVSANGFLYKMVRILMGSLIRVGQGILTKQDLKRLLEEGKEWPQKVPAAPYGLYLLKADYKDAF